MNKNKQLLKAAQNELTEYVISQLNSGHAWSACFNVANGLPKSINTGKAYKGFNLLWLMLTQDVKEYNSSQWGTFKSWKTQGARVKKGEKGTSIVFSKPIKKEDKEGNEKVFFVLKRYVLFNRCQVEGLEENADQSVESVSCDSGILFKYTEQEDIEVRFTDSKPPCYIPSKDRICLPTAFTNEAGGWSTVAHEIIHSTGASNRLNREGVTGMKKDLHQYSYEELVAELGSLFLCSSLGLSTEESKEQSAAYLASWAKVLKSNPEWIWKASAEASRAVEYVQSIINKE